MSHGTEGIRDREQTDKPFTIRQKIQEAEAAAAADIFAFVVVIVGMGKREFCIQFTE